MVQCFDTLTEYIQGPCYENQVALIQGSFLDLASILLSVILSIFLINYFRKINKYDYNNIFLKASCMI
jgi:hypothetical protein